MTIQSCYYIYFLSIFVCACLSVCLYMFTCVVLLFFFKVCGLVWLQHLPIVDLYISLVTVLFPPVQQMSWERGICQSKERGVWCEKRKTGRKKDKKDETIIGMREREMHEKREKKIRKKQSKKVWNKEIKREFREGKRDWQTEIEKCMERQNKRRRKWTRQTVGW